MTPEDDIPPSEHPYPSSDREKTGKIRRDGRFRMPNDDDDLPQVQSNEWNLSLLGRLLFKAGYDIRMEKDQIEFISDILFLKEMRVKNVARRAQAQWFMRAAIGAILTGLVGAFFLWAGNIFPHVGIK